MKDNMELVKMPLDYYTDYHAWKYLDGRDYIPDRLKDFMYDELYRDIFWGCVHVQWSNLYPHELCYLIKKYSEENCGMFTDFFAVPYTEFMNRHFDHEENPKSARETIYWNRYEDQDFEDVEPWMILDFIKYVAKELILRWVFIEYEHEDYEELYYDYVIEEGGEYPYNESNCGNDWFIPDAYGDYVRFDHVEPDDPAYYKNKRV